MNLPRGSLKKNFSRAEFAKHELLAAVMSKVTRLRDIKSRAVKVISDKPQSAAKVMKSGFLAVLSV